MQKARRTLKWENSESQEKNCLFGRKVHLISGLLTGKVFLVEKGRKSEEPGAIRFIQRVALVACRAGRLPAT